MRKFFKQVMQVTVYSENVPLEWDDLNDVYYAIDQGDCVGKVEELSCQQITPAEAAKGLQDAGSTADFFELTNDGRDLESV